MKSRVNPFTLIQSACEVQNDFPRSVVIDGSRYSSGTRFHHQLGTERRLWSTVDEDVAFASSLCIVDALETTCQGHSCAPW